MNENIISELSNFIFNYIKKLGLKTQEDKVEKFIKELCAILHPLTLPIDRKYLLANFKLKSMYSLWITLIDDSIDQGEDIRNEICENITFLSESAIGKNFLPKSICGNILNDILQNFPQYDKNKKEMLIIDLAFSDLLGDLYGFFYELITRYSQEVVTMTEYIEHSRNTIDFLFCLDCDLFFFRKIELNEIMLLREAHRHFGMAFRLLNDLATFEKEFYIEKTPNLAALRLERDKITNNIKIDEKRKNIVFGELRLDIIEYRKKIKDVLSKIKSFNTDTYYNNICNVLKKYPMNLENSRNEISNHIFQE